MPEGATGGVGNRPPTVRGSIRFFGGHRMRCCRWGAGGSGRAFADVDAVGGAFGGGVGFCGDFFGEKAGALEAREEGGFGFGGPEGDASAGEEGASDEGEAVGGVEAGVFWLDEGGGAVVHVEEDGVVVARVGFDTVEDVSAENADTRVVENAGVEIGEEGAIPSDDVGEEFGDFDEGVR